MKRKFYYPGAFIFAFLSLQCSQKKSESSSTRSLKAKPSLLRLEASNYNSLTYNLDMPSLATSQTITTDVNILSLKYPIGNISISSKGTGSGTGDLNSFLYECSGTSNDECLIDLTGAALTDLLANSEAKVVEAGTYSQVNISPCFQDGTENDIAIKLKASVTINSTTYYTNATSGLSTTAPAEEVTIKPKGGCGGVNFLTREIIVSADSFKTREIPVEEGATPQTSGALKEQLNLKLYFDLANAVYASNGSGNTSESDVGSFCAGSGSRAYPYICVNFPQIIGTVDSGEPALKRMLINSNTIWGFYFNSDGVAFGAYQRSYYNGTYTTEPEFLVGAMFEKFTNNEDGTVNLCQYDDNQDRHLCVKNFKFENHSGTMTRGASGTLNYTATKL